MHRHEMEKQDKHYKQEDEAENRTQHNAPAGWNEQNTLSVLGERRQFWDEASLNVGRDTITQRRPRFSVRLAGCPRPAPLPPPRGSEQLLALGRPLTWLAPSTQNQAVSVPGDVQLLQKAQNPHCTPPPSPGLETTEGQANLKPTSMEGTVFTFYSLVPRELGAGGWSAPTSRVDTWSWWSQQCHPWDFPWCLPGSVTGRIPQLRSYKRRKAACHERRAKKSTVGRGRCR